MEKSDKESIKTVSKKPSSTHKKNITKVDVAKKTRTKKTPTKKVEKSSPSKSTTKNSKTQQKTNDKSSTSSGNVVAPRKHVRKIPQSNTDVFHKSSVVIPSKTNAKRIGNLDYWKQGDLFEDLEKEGKKSDKKEGQSKPKLSEKKESKGNEKKEVKTVKKTPVKTSATKPKQPSKKKKELKKSFLEKNLSIILSILIFLVLLILFIIPTFLKIQNSKEPIVIEKSVNTELNSNIAEPLNVEEADNIRTLSFQIVKGDSATAVAKKLEDLNLVQSTEFLTYVENNALTQKINVGTYEVQTDIDLKTLVNKITVPNETSITIYPGATLADIDSMLYQRGLINKGDFIEACSNICKDNGLSFVEGWFLPGKYVIRKDEDISKLADTSFTNMLHVLSNSLSKIVKTNYSVEEVLIIASLIQGETQDVEQMPYIARVILNRLDKDMPLGIDATTRYELGDWKSELTQEILDKQTPYNTRRKRGLVPSGICQPSEAAINAVLNPADGDYLYYIHDKDGSIIMANSYQEHLENIERRDQNGL